jgi:hypothetical protein
MPWLSQSPPPPPGVLPTRPTHPCGHACSLLLQSTFALFKSLVSSEDAARSNKGPSVGGKKGGEEGEGEDEEPGRKFGLDEAAVMEWRRLKVMQLA